VPPAWRVEWSGQGRCHPPC